MASPNIPSSYHKLIVLVVAASIHTLSGFGFVPPTRFSWGASLSSSIRSKVRISPAPLRAKSTAAVAEIKEDEASLVLRADYVGQSKLAPVTSQEAMIDFFRDPKHCACLISAGNTRESHTVRVTDELLQRWKRRATSLGASEPETSDNIISVRTGGIRFPGVTVESTSLIGSKLILPTESTGFPSYEFVLIQDQREATGLRPIVWIYNQLTGAGNTEREKDAAPMSLSRVAPCPTEDGENVTFKIDSFLEIRIKFPVVLLKILPVSKEKAEAQGADAVIKVLKKDIDVSIEKFRDIYAETLQA